MIIKNLVITLAFKELGNEELTVVNKPYKKDSVRLELVPMLITKELDQLVYDYRVEYPETANVSLTFRCVDFLDQKDQEPYDSYNQSH